MRTTLILSTLLLSLVASAQDGGTPRTIVLIPLGEVDDASMKVVAIALKARVNADVRVDPKRPMPKESWHAPRSRWRAEKIIDNLEANPPAGAWRVVAITAAEISTTKDAIPDWRIAGLGSLDGKNCVLSTWIYRKHFGSQQTYDRRLADLTVHEFGHTLGLEHCETDACVMRDAMGKALESADTSTTQFCAVCRKQIDTGILEPLPK